MAAVDTTETAVRHGGRTLGQFETGGERTMLGRFPDCQNEAEETRVLNRYERPSPMAGEAEVRFLDGDFRVIRPGAFVRCAVTNVPIPLEELKYWSVDLQEAYATPDAVKHRFSDGAADKAG
jgi:hypothetical protein